MEIRRLLLSYLCLFMIMPLSADRTVFMLPVGEATETCPLDAIEPLTCASWHELLQAQEERKVPGLIVARIVSQGYGQKYVHYVDAAHWHKRTHTSWPYPVKAQKSILWQDNPINGKPIIEEIQYFAVHADTGVSMPLGSTADLYAKSNAGTIMRHTFDVCYSNDAAKSGASGVALGDIYRSGRGIPQDEARALSYYAYAAHVLPEGLLRIRSVLGMADLYYTGSASIAKNWSKAAFYYQEVAEKIGVNAEMRDEYRKIVRKLSSMYHTGGHELPMQYAAAAHWYEILLPLVTGDADLSLRVSFELGKLYHFGGHGMKSDYGRAEAHYQRAHMLSASPQYTKVHARSALALGELYRVGDSGLPKDYKQAALWYGRVRDQEHDAPARSRACLALGDICCEGGCGLERNMEEAARAYGLIEHDAQELVRITAQHALAKMYRDGSGVPRDINRSITMFQALTKQTANVRIRDEAIAALHAIGQSAASVAAAVTTALEGNG